MRKFDISVTDAAPDAADDRSYQSVDLGPARAYQSTDNLASGRAYQSDASVNRARRSTPTEPPESS